jgi:branched-chain amino acid transport system ATP-binding protein
LSVEQIFELFPHLKERLHSQGTKLSGGEQQMLAIGRILRTGAPSCCWTSPPKAWRR